MNTSRIPEFSNKSRHGMAIWFAEMSLRGLTFHPEDAPSSIITIATGDRAFTDVECAKLDAIMVEMFALFGDDVCDICYPIFMRDAARAAATSGSDKANYEALGMFVARMNNLHTCCNDDSKIAARKACWLWGEDKEITAHKLQALLNDCDMLANL